MSSNDAKVDNNNVSRSGSSEKASSTAKPRAKQDMSKSPFFADDSLPTTQKWATLKGLLAHTRNKTDMKRWIRTSVALWVMLVLVLVNPILREYGQATFLGLVVLVIAPPSNSLWLNVFVGFSLLLGECVMWAWCAIVMKAAQSTRPSSETDQLKAGLGQQIQLQVSQSGGTLSVAQVTRQLVNDGWFLDPRISVTYYCLLLPAVYLVSRLRVIAPKAVLFQIFSLITADVFLTSGILIPDYMASIGKSIVLPSATAIAISLACSLLIFPESTSYGTLTGVELILGPVPAFLDACRHSYSNYPSYFSINALTKTRIGILGAAAGVKASIGFLPLDFSYGRWNTKDIMTLVPPLQEFVLRSLALVQIQHNFERRRQKHVIFTDYDKQIESGEWNEKLPKHGRHQLLHHVNFYKRLEFTERAELTGKALNALDASCGALLDACAESVIAVQDAIHIVNTRRWWCPKAVIDDAVARHTQTLERLHAERAACARNHPELLLEPHRHLFDDEGNLRDSGDDKDTARISSLFLTLVLEEKIDQFANAVQKLLETTVELEQKRPKSRLWFPSGLQHVFQWMFSHQPPPSVGSPTGFEKANLGDGVSSAEKPRLDDDSYLSESSTDDEKSPARQEAGKEASEILESLHFVAGHRRSKTSRAIIAVLKWITSTEGVYAFRIVVLTLAISLPAHIKASSGFFQRQRGLWAVIMAQTGSMPYTSDFIWGLITRVAATVFGGTLGLLTWYIGSGDGDGNPYGTAAICVPVFLFLMYLRLFSPPQYLQFAMFTGATFFVVWGYSWVDNHLELYDTPGAGYTVYWRRVLLVLVGFAAATIMLLFPRPPSATRDIGRVLAGNLRVSKDMYALMLASWSSPYKGLTNVAMQNVLSNIEMLGGLAARLPFLKLEFTRSPLDQATLTRAAQLGVIINTDINQLIMYEANVGPDLKLLLNESVAAVDERLVGDLMGTLSLLEQTLITGDPLPAIMPGPLIKRMVDYSAFAQRSSGSQGWTLDLLRRKDFRSYCVLLNAFLNLLFTVDELTFVLKSCVGEEHVVTQFASPEAAWAKQGAAA